MKAVIEAEAELEKKTEEPYSLRGRNGRNSKKAPLSMRERLAARHREPEAEPIEPPTAAPASVVINTAPQAASSDPIPLLAKWVAAGESYQRRERLKTAGTQLAAFTEDEAQCVEWIERLADEVAKLDRRKNEA